MATIVEMRALKVVLRLEIDKQQRIGGRLRPQRDHSCIRIILDTAASLIMISREESIDANQDQLTPVHLRLRLKKSAAADITGLV